MAMCEMRGLSEVLQTLERAVYIPDEVQDEMLQAEAAVVVAAQQAKARAYGVQRTGMTLESIKAGKPRKGKKGRYINVSPQGKNAKGERNATVGFVNEYGVPSRGIPARPFTRDANEEAADEMVAAGADVYGRYLEQT